MKILYIIDSLGTGGAERSTSYLWYYLRQQNIDLRIVCLRVRKEGIQEEILNAKFNVEFLSKDSLYGHSKEINAIIKEYHPDIVHSVLWKSNIRTRIARLRHRFFHIESLVNLTYAEARARDSKVGHLKLLAYKIIDKYTGLFGVDHFHANGENVAMHYRKHLSISADKVSIVRRGRFPNTSIGKKEALQQQIRSVYKIPDDTVVLINVGRHEYQKGQDLLLDALGKIKKTSTWRFKLLIAGRDGNASGEIKNKIRAWSLEHEVILMGHRNDIPELLVSADIFVFPSRFEGFPGALIEAEAAGLPIICTDLPVMHEVVIKGENCETFEAENSDGLAQAIVKLVSNSELRKQYARASLKQFQDNFVIDVINEKMLHMYQQLVKKEL